MPTAVELDAATDVALAFRSATKTISGRLSAILAALWAGVDLSAPVASWAGHLPAALGAFAAAQEASAGMADGYLRDVLAAQGRSPEPAALVDPLAFAGRAASGMPLDALLTLPVMRASEALGRGMTPVVARSAVAGSLAMYAQTEVPDASRLSVSASLVSHRVGGYIREVGSLCCSRCAILSGRWYRYSSGFQRHPRCHCVNVPCAEVSQDRVTSPMDLFRQGRITDLSDREREAVGLGADLSQVVNARQGMYVADGREMTTTGATRRGIAGARILARDMARARGADAGGTFRDLTVSKHEVAAYQAKYGPLMRNGLPFERKTALGRQTSAYRFTRSGRMSVSTILSTASSREDAVRQLINHGYLIA